MSKKEEINKGIEALFNAVSDADLVTAINLDEDEAMEMYGTFALIKEANEAGDADKRAGLQANYVKKIVEYAARTVENTPG